MKKATIKNLISLALTFVFVLIFAIAVLAATPGTGYTVNDQMEPTNIKWTMTEDGVLTFEIDPMATDKVQTTELYGKDPVTGTTHSWNKNLPTYAEAVKIVIGDGITAITGFSANKNLLEVELAPSVTTLGSSVFQTDHNLKSVYIKGNLPIEGCFDLSNITSMSIYSFDDCRKLTKVTLNPDYVGVIPLECFKETALEEIEIPEGVTEIVDKVFMKTQKLKVVTLLGMETTLASDDVFAENNSYPTIKAKSGSKAAEFAKANGYTFIDLDTGETTNGTNSTEDENNEPTPAVTEFKPEGATLWGRSSGTYNDKPIINTWWAYYDDTKTLEFVSATTSYNETGDLGDVDKEYTDWSKYKNEIEHIIVGDNIDKISGNAFMNYTALKDVRLGKKVTQIDGNAFTGCASLTTIWRDGSERIEGRMDFTSLKKMNDIVTGTVPSEVVLPKAVTELEIILSSSVKTIYAYDVTDSLIEYAKTNLFNIQSIKNPSIKHEFWVYVDPNLPACGGRSVFSFDEATGILTVYGAGKIDDIVNYYGGGSKAQPWFEIKNQVKHIVLSDNITSIGKYAFCEFSNLETVQIPASERFEILNAAFEKCYNLKSIYRSGDKPIEGTLDIRNVHELNSWSFAYDYLIANIIISPEVTKIGTSVFEENITLNLANVYGTPGSFAETYASENGKTFYDITTTTPLPITCNPPETTEKVTETLEITDAPETTAEPEITTAPETERETENVTTAPKVQFVNENDIDSNAGGADILPTIVIAAVAVIVTSVIIVIIVYKKKVKSEKR